MSKPYIKNHYGDSCFYRDTPLKQYNRYCDSHGDTLIFNFGCNGYSGGAYSMGCYNHGSFWGGFGAGIGHGIANLLGGLVSGFMNIPFFGGLFGMSSFGMPSYGGLTGMSTFGMPYSYTMMPSYLGLGGPDASSSDTGLSGSSGSSAGTGNVNTGNGTDEDVAKLNELRGKFRTEIAQDSPNIDNLQDLYNEIKGLSENPLDEVNKDANKTGYKDLLDEFKLYVDFKSNEPDKIDKTKDLESPQDSELINKLYSKLNLPSDVTPKALFNKGIRPTLLQYKNNEVIWGLSMPKDPSDKDAIELLAKCGKNEINVAFQHNSNDNAYDKWIIGTFKDVTTTEDGKLESYKIDCSTFAGSEHRHTYKLTLSSSGSWREGVILHNESDSEQEDKTLNWDSDKQVYERGKEQTNYKRT